MSQQVLTLIGTIIGAVLGFLAPLGVSTLGRREKRRDAQQATAADIMALFESGASLAAEFAARESLQRRKLYLAALRLDSGTARQACLRFIACAGSPPVDEDTLADAWDVMINEVGAVYRRSRRGAV